MTKNPLPENLSVGVPCDGSEQAVRLPVDDQMDWVEEIDRDCELIGYLARGPEWLELLSPPLPRRRRKPHGNVAGGLKTAAQAAAKLNCSTKTLNSHVKAGELKYVIVGRGTKRPRRYFTVADLDAFIANQTREDSPSWPSSRIRARHTGASTSNSKVIAFTAQPKPRPGVKPKK